MPKPNSRIPAWVIGLWREWADWRQSDGYDGDLDRGADIAAMDLAMRTPGVVSQGPVVRALIALEQAQHGPAAMVDLFYRQLPDELKTIIWGVYVERMSFARLSQGDEARAKAISRAHTETSIKLGQRIQGLYVLKGDERALKLAILTKAVA